MDIDKGTEKLEKADNFLTKLKQVLKKHWGILIAIGLAGCIYWVFSDLGDISEGLEEAPMEEYVSPDEWYGDSLGVDGDTIEIY